jgi:tetrapyrrole methylase family protein/MazG family protein
VAPKRPCITVVGLGPGGEEHLPDAVVRALAADPGLAYLRTRRHPSAARFAEARSFDALYDAATTFEDVYTGIVEELVSAATAAAPAPVVYAVPGSPLVAERTVELLRADARVDVTVVPALSFLDLVWDRLGIDPLREGVQLLDAAEFSTAAGARGPFLVGQCWNRDLLSDIKLAPAETEPRPGADGGLPRPVILHHLGLEDEVVVSVDWWDLDRAVVPDHLTSVFIPALPEPLPAGPAAAGHEVARLVSLMDILRTQCPWDRAQTHATLMPHLVEECYEVLDALAALADADAPARAGAHRHLEEELGDLLFQIVFHARLAAEDGAFDLGDVARGIHDKLVHRHPHVFGDVEADSPGVVLSNWEAIKKHEKGRRSVTEGIPTNLPALMLSNKLARKARSVGLDPDSATHAAAAADGLRALAAQAATADLHPDDPLAHDEPEVAAAVGDILFVVADVAQRLGIDAEHALRARALTLRDEVVAAESVPDQENDSH